MKEILINLQECVLVPDGTWGTHSSKSNFHSCTGVATYRKSALPWYKNKFYINSALIRNGFPADHVCTKNYQVSTSSFLQM